jgi:hypothetical protein
MSGIFYPFRLEHKNPANQIPMKTRLQILAVIAISLLTVGCASAIKEKQNLAIAAGFKAITPVKPEHIELLPKLPKNTMSQISYQGKAYYVLPDVENNQAFVGGPAEYQAYQKLSLQKQISDANLQAAQMNQMAAMNSMNWSAWGGWGAVGPMGYPYRYGYRR